MAHSRTLLRFPATCSITRPATAGFPSSAVASNLKATKVHPVRKDEPEVVDNHSTSFTRFEMGINPNGFSINVNDEVTHSDGFTYTVVISEYWSPDLVWLTLEKPTYA